MFVYSTSGSVVRVFVKPRLLLCARCSQIIFNFQRRYISHYSTCLSSQHSCHIPTAITISSQLDPKRSSLANPFPYSHHEAHPTSPPQQNPHHPRQPRSTRLRTYRNLHHEQRMRYRLRRVCDLNVSHPPSCYPTSLAIIPNTHITLLTRS